MNRGFYTLGSGMITQSRTMNTITNNLANSKTPGFKKDIIETKTFGELYMHRIENNKLVPLSDVSMFKTVSASTKIHSQGTTEPSERALDFAIVGEGFFAVKDGEQTSYTRHGSFNLDAEGYLILEGVGRIQGEDGDIYVGTDKVTSDEAGNIFGEDGEQIATLQLYNFEDYNALLTVGEGFFRMPEGGAAPTPLETPTIKGKTIEGSNVDVSKEMTSSIETQRILQSVAQALKMYDQTLQSATTQIGRL